MFVFPLTDDELRAVVRTALEEDGAFDDLTTIATVVSDRTSRAMMVARAPGVVCGVSLALEAFRQLDESMSARVDCPDGSHVKDGAEILFVSGTPRALLSAERVALNFIQRLSGVASITARYVEAIRGTNAKIIDTRKTTPGWRLLEKYAVRAGGGTNHRMGLSTGVLIKDNHLAALDGDIGLAVSRARELAPKDMKIEVECDRADQVKQAIAAGADIILLDNMSVETMAECVRLVNGRAIVEASGGVNLSTVRKIAETGVDWISVGALTHSTPSLDIGLDFE